MKKLLIATLVLGFFLGAQVTDSFAAKGGNGKGKGNGGGNNNPLTFDLVLTDPINLTGSGTITTQTSLIEVNVVITNTSNAIVSFSDSVSTRVEIKSIPRPPKKVSLAFSGEVNGGQSIPAGGSILQSLDVVTLLQSLTIKSYSVKCGFTLENFDDGQTVEDVSTVVTEVINVTS